MECEIAGQNYRADKLSAFAQLHVARKIAPVLGGLATLAQGADSAAMLQTMAEVVAAMPDADCDYVVQTCLAVTQRQQENNRWAPVWNAQCKALMFDDIGLGQMIQIAQHVIQDSLGNFLHGLTANPDTTGQARTAHG